MSHTDLGEALGRLPIRSEATQRLQGLIDLVSARIDDPARHLVVAVVGPSGAGKSTLINSLAGEVVSPAGPLRPTSLQPVAWTGADVPAILTGMRHRIEGRIVESVHRLVERITIVDTPPPGPDGRHDAIAGLADVIVFVTSPLRYADAAPWAVIAAAVGRDAEILPVLNRVTPGRHDEVLFDFERRLGEAGVAIGPIVVDEQPGLIDGLLASPSVAGLRKELEAVSDRPGRDRVRGRVVAGAEAAMASWQRRLTTEIEEYQSQRDAVIDVVNDVYGDAASDLVTQRATGGLADLAASEADVAIAGLAAVVTNRSGRAARQTAARVAAGSPAGLIDRRSGLYGHGPETLDLAKKAIRQWWDNVPDIIRGAVSFKIRTRRLRRLTHAARLLVLAPQTSTPRRTRRRLERNPSILGAVGGRLDAALVGVMAADGERFADAVGPDITPDEMAVLSGRASLDA